MLAKFSNVTLYYTNEYILDEISFQINPGDKIGIVGKNGAGKSTLLKLLTGELSANKGIIDKSKNVKIGYLKQHLEYDADKTMIEIMYDAFGDLLSLKNELHDLEEKMRSNSKQIDRISEVYGEKLHYFEEVGGYDIQHKIDKVVIGLGFSKDDMSKKVSVMSGGEKSRVVLGKLLLEEPELLLLDEPTNHLDIKGVEWLEEYLKSYEKSVLIVSHDRYFLDNIINRTAEIENTKLTMYKGNYSHYLRQKEERRELLQKEYDKQQKIIEKNEKFIAKNIVGTKTKQAQSRQKMLTKLDNIKPPESPNKKAVFKFTPSKKGAMDVLDVKEVSKQFDNKKVLNQVSFDVKRGDRFGIVGANGTGKSTLLKIIIGKVQSDNGETSYGDHIDPGYFSQEFETQNTSNSIIDEVWQIKPEFTTTEIRTFLAKFLFIGEDVFKIVGELSGGERSRVELAKLILSGVNFLILDEPTNHLDIESRIVLEEALLDYPGTILTVSHDRFFLDKITDRILYLDNGKYDLIKGNYTEFHKWQKENSALAVKEEVKNSKEEYEKQKKLKNKANKLKRKIRKTEVIENDILETEEKIEDIKAKLALPEVYNDHDKLKKVDAEYNKLKLKLSELYEEWEENQE